MERLQGMFVPLLCRLEPCYLVSRPSPMIDHTMELDKEQIKRTTSRNSVRMLRKDEVCQCFLTKKPSKSMTVSAAVT